ncbi:hypothetical protein FRB99_006095, partial [Tulasnella sp. 403]
MINYAQHLTSIPIAPLSTVLHRQLISRLATISRSGNVVTGVADLGGIFTFDSPPPIALHKKAGNSDIAVKVLRAGDITDSEELDRLAKRLGREMSIWKALKHKRITPLMGFAILEIGACLISPWCDNGNALEYLKKCPSVDRRRLCNVLINNEGDAMLCDFGLSKLLQDVPSGFTTTTRQKGTTRWMAPEQFGEHAVYTTQSDIYAFGCLVIGMISPFIICQLTKHACIAEIMCEKVPFVKYTNDAGIVLAKVQGMFMEPKDYPELPEDDPLWRILRECWATNPQLRPSINGVHNK